MNTMMPMPNMQQMMSQPSGMPQMDPMMMQMLMSGMTGNPSKMGDMAHMMNMPGMMQSMQHENTDLDNRQHPDDDESRNTLDRTKSHNQRHVRSYDNLPYGDDSTSRQQDHLPYDEHRVNREEEEVLSQTHADRDRVRDSRTEREESKDSSMSFYILLLLLSRY